LALEEYKRKRDFKATPEPPPDKPKPKQGFSYLIQKHDATRLHYDLRLELDGVLLSWAVTKGPSLNPADKRLAVRTEDHPLSYGTFEGTIPKGQYGGGTVMLWDRGHWESKWDPHFGLHKGHLAFTLHGERLKGGWDLIRMRTKEKRENWLLIKHKDEYSGGEADAEKFLADEVTSVVTGRTMDEIAVDAPAKKKASPVAEKTLTKLMEKYPDVQLATLVTAPPEGDQWVHEIKLDGYRLLAFLVDRVVRLRTRNGNDWTRKFPSILASVAKLKAKSAVIDMEAAITDGAGKTSFHAIQNALGDGGNAQGIEGYAFDLLYLDGRDLTAEPLVKRKKELAALLKISKDAEFLHFSDHVAGHGGEMFAQSCQLGVEGIVSKLADSRYRPGRQQAWTKAKCLKRQEFIIVGFTDAKSGGRAIGALHLGYFRDGALRYAGRVGTGFSMRDAKEIHAKLEPLVTRTPPIPDLPRSLLRLAHWVKPELLCEVGFAEFTDDGYVRHSSFQDLREDKKPRQVTLEKPFKVLDAAPAGPHTNSTARAIITASPGVVTVKHPPTARSAKSKDRIELFGIGVSHPDRVIFQDVGLTKGALAEYYAAVSPWMMRNIADHPLTLLRCPEGMSGDCFYQRSPGMGLGPDVKLFKWKHKGKWYDYLYIEDKKGLIELAQMGTIEIHPWGARHDHIDFPDRLIFDLDPDEGVPFEALRLAARDLRQRLFRRKLDSFLKCTGGKGLHITVPLDGKTRWAEAKAFCAGIAEEMVRDVPSAYVATMTKAKRTGKIFVDYFRNDYTATAVADFSVRARPGAPVAVPLEWNELGKMTAANQFTVADVLKRVRHKPPNPARYEHKQRLPA
jgi:bifunctional non-homologous end joining protein LigD